MAEASWRAIAESLASRMENHDFCEDHGVIDEGVEEGCPFCLDRVTMRTYREKAQSVQRRERNAAFLSAAREIERQS
ncbi:hypothetical protein GCM10009651_35870 [Microbacterium natoriense]|uniref:hypothetical protein n=1 Tax=Microbacterium natoriense TaxID=284570 RepID=UPI0031D97A38